MSLTGQQLLSGYSTFIDDNEGHTTTSAGASDGSTLVDTALEKYGDGRLVGRFIRITLAGSTQYAVSRVTNNIQATGTLTLAPAFIAQVASATTYEIHQYEPVLKYAALDSARISVSNDVFRLIVDETITTDGYSSEYAIPSTIHRGPALVYVETIPWSPVVTWNFCPAAQSDDTMSNWTASNCTLSSYSRVPQDFYVPKFGPACTEVKTAASVASTLTLPVSKMINGITATLAAGRQMTAAIWVYCRVASVVTLSVLDDSGTLGTSAAHQGKGWELLNVEVVITQNNITTLSLRLSESTASAITYFVNNQWFYYGYYTQINSQFYSAVPARIRRDDTNKRFILAEPIEQRRQLRVVGKEILTSLGNDTVTQTTNTMEVDVTTAEILYATAAKIMFEQERISTNNLPQVMQRIQSVQDRLSDIRMNWDLDLSPQRLTSPYMR